MWLFIADVVQAAWDLFVEMAPYLLFGFAVAGGLSLLLTPGRVSRHLGVRGVWSAVKAAVFGIPLPLCSCSVIPVTASVRRNGATREATTAFILSTPQTGVDSIAVTYALMGPVLAVVRPIVALASGILGGTVAWLASAPDEEAKQGDAAKADADCGDANRCDADHHGDAKTGVSWFARLKEAAHHGFIILPRDIGLPLIVGIVVAAVVTVLFPERELQQYLGPGLLSIIIAMALSVPLYVCATASVPLAVGFIHAGASPGAAIAFLVAGPATNAATISAVWRVLGLKNMGIYLATVAVTAVGFGWSVDAFAPYVLNTIPESGAHEHAMPVVSWTAWLSAVALLAVLLYSSSWTRWLATWLMKAAPTTITRKRPAEDEMADGAETVWLAIEGMTCDHCRRTVQRALSGAPGVAAADVDLAEKIAAVRLSGDGGPREEVQEEMCSRVRQAGYEVSLKKEAGTASSP